MSGLEKKEKKSGKINLLGKLISGFRRKIKEPINVIPIQEKPPIIEEVKKIEEIEDVKVKVMSSENLIKKIESCDKKLENINDLLSKHLPTMELIDQNKIYEYMLDLNKWFDITNNISSFDKFTKDDKESLLVKIKELSEPFRDCLRNDLNSNENMTQFVDFFDGSDIGFFTKI